MSGDNLGWVGGMAETGESAGPVWKKSSRSAANGHCVEVAKLTRRVIGVRDSKDTTLDRPVLTFDLEEWHSFLRGVVSQEFNLP